jgi:single-strand DNA-binding protein
MSGTVNKVILVGNLGADPEIRSLGGDRRVANLRIATSESWNDKASGERKEKTEWHTVSVFVEGLIKTIERYVKKGHKVYLEGQLVTRKYEKDGQERYSTEIHLQGFNSVMTMLTAPGEGGDAGQSGGGQRSGGSSGGQSGGQRRDPAPKATDYDDDVPF